MFKFILDTLIRGYALYFVYAWSAHLLAAIWLALTHLFLSLTKPREILGAPWMEIGASTGTVPKAGLRLNTRTSPTYRTMPLISSSTPLKPAEGAPAKNETAPRASYEHLALGLARSA